MVYRVSFWGGGKVPTNRKPTDPGNKHIELHVIPPSIGNPYKWVYKPHGFDEDHLPNHQIRLESMDLSKHIIITVCPNEAIKTQFETSKHETWTTFLKRALIVRLFLQNDSLLITPKIFIWKKWSVISLSNPSRNNRLPVLSCFSNIFLVTTHISTTSTCSNIDKNTTNPILPQKTQNSSGQFIINP